jgi:hypothetical protein
VACSTLNPLLWQFVFWARSNALSSLTPIQLGDEDPPGRFIDMLRQDGLPSTRNVTALKKALDSSEEDWLMEFLGVSMSLEIMQ